MRRGFSLLEVLVSLAILSLLVGLAVLGAGQAPKASSRQLAEVVAAHLRSARALAISQNVPVAVSFPSNGGTTPLAQSCSVWQGEHQPRCLKVISLAGEFPQAQIYFGGWPATPPAVLGPPVVAGNSPAFLFNQWYSPQPVPKDYLVVFKPDGSLETNDQPLIAGAYRLVTCLGANFAPTSPPSGTARVTPRPNYYSLSAVRQATTITLECNGSIQVEDGLTAQDGSVALQTGAFGTAGVAHSLSRVANTVPVVTKLTLSPAAGSALPPGVDAQVSPDEKVELVMEAGDSDGDRLYCSWSADGGGFTSPGRTRMEWDANAGVWRGHWTFRPNPNDPFSRHYQLHCVVEDERGTPAIAGAGVDLNPYLELVPNNRIVFSHFPQDDIWVMNGDGSNLHSIPAVKLIGSPCELPDLSPDGTQIMALSTNANELWAISVDGSWARPLTNSGGNMGGGGTWSPLGNAIAYTDSSGPGTDYFLMPASGAVTPPTLGSPFWPPRRMTTGMNACWSKASFNQTGTKVCFVTGPTAGSQGVYVYDIPTATGSFIVPPQAYVDDRRGIHFASFCTNPATPDLLVMSVLDNVNNSHLEAVNVDGSNRRTLSLPGVSWLDCPSWSPDGLHLAIVGDALETFDYDPATQNLSNHKILGEVPDSLDW